MLQALQNGLRHGAARNFVAGESIEPGQPVQMDHRQISSAQQEFMRTWGLPARKF